MSQSVDICFLLCYAFYIKSKWHVFQTEQNGEVIVNKEVDQIKFTIESNIVSKFKIKCKSEGVSMTSVIRQYMLTGKPAKNNKLKTDTRPQRKKAVLSIIDMLNDIMQMEQQYRDNIPEQFQSRYEISDQTCEQISQAIICLEDAF